MRRLRDFQAVSLHVGDMESAVRIVAVGGNEAVVDLGASTGDPRVALPAKATLAFEAGGQMVMLSGMAAEGLISDSLRFFVVDGVARGDSRLHPRLTVRLATRVTPCDANGVPMPASTFMRETVDICAGGILLAGRPLPPGSPVVVEFVVPGLAEPLRATANVVRHTPKGTALAFTDLDADVGESVDRIIFMVRQRMARAASARRDASATAR